MTEQTPIVLEAIVALAPFRITNPADASKILAMWRRFPEMTAAEVRSVLDHFQYTSGRCGESVPQAGYDDACPPSHDCPHCYDNISPVGGAAS